ncbi:MAG TPA: alpha/beta hydrolase [Longimicrobiales bacterium]|nr:alpha/beta hydrolase [Longimicrobiales bacterium]
MIEKAVRFGPERTLVGVWSEPEEPVPSDDRVVVVMVNSGIIHHVGAWRLYVRLARALAGVGVASLRFDLSGVGDSGYALEAESLNASVLRDMDHAIAYVRDTRGWPRVVMSGLCSGAVDAIQAASSHHAVVGVVAIDLLADFRNWRHHAVRYGSRLLRWESWKNTLLGRNGTLSAWLRATVGRRAGGPDTVGTSSVDGGRRPLTRQETHGTVGSIVARGTDVLFAFSAGLEHNYNHRGQFAGVFPDLAADPRITVMFFPDADHTFSDRAQQRALIEAAVDWTAGRFGPHRRRGAPGPGSTDRVATELPLSSLRDS